MDKEIESRAILERNSKGEYILYITSGPRGSPALDYSSAEIKSYIEKRTSGSYISTTSMGHGDTFKESEEEALDVIKEKCRDWGVRDVRGVEF